MHAKGMLLRDEENRTHRYRPVVQQGETQKSLVKNLLSIAFGGSSTSLAMQALGQEKPSKEELKEIRAFLDQLEKENR
jgi:predicted transcriptional regulator